MKLVRSTDSELLFRLSTQEHRLLETLLSAYPVVPKAPTGASTSAAGSLSAELLDEALADHREENRKRVQALLAPRGRLRKTESGARLTLKHADTEWFLQVLNEVRVGSWIRLGSPDEMGDPFKLFQIDPEAFTFMEAAAVFQMQLLDAFRKSRDALG